MFYSTISLYEVPAVVHTTRCQSRRHIGSQVLNHICQVYSVVGSERR